MAGSAQVIANMNRWAASKKIALQALGKVVGANMEAYAKTNARWQPVTQPKYPRKYTGMARSRLKGGTYTDSSGIYSYVAHSMDYGFWLELAMDRKYAILEESRDKFKDVAYKSAERIMGGL